MSERCWNCGQHADAEIKLNRLVSVFARRGSGAAYALDRLAAVKAEALKSRSKLAAAILNICDGVTPRGEGREADSRE